MPNPTRQQIINAHDALDTLYKRAAEVAPNSALKTYVLAALPPRPQPTMAEIKWDDEKHYLAEAEHQYCGEVIMLGPDEGGLIEFFVPKLRASRYDAAYPGSLTLTGRRYTLTEVQE